MIGSLAAMALLGMVTGMSLNHKGPGRSNVIPSRVRQAAENAIPGPRTGRRRKKRKTKAAAP